MFERYLTVWGICQVVSGFLRSSNVLLCLWHFTKPFQSPAARWFGIGARRIRLLEQYNKPWQQAHFPDYNRHVSLDDVTGRIQFSFQQNVSHHFNTHAAIHIQIVWLWMGFLSSTVQCSPLDHQNTSYRLYSYYRHRLHNRYFLRLSMIFCTFSFFLYIKTS